MAILYRTLSPLTIGGMEARLTVYGNGNRLRVELEPYAPVSTTVYGSGLEVTFTYNGESVPVSAATFTRPLNVLFDRCGGVQEIQMTSSAGIVYRDIPAETHTIRWSGDGSVPAPTVTVLPYPGLMRGKTSKISWAITGVPEGYTAYTVGIWYYYAPEVQIDPVYTRYSLLSERFETCVWEHRISNLDIGQVLYYRIAVAFYRNAGDAEEDYVAYAEIDSPAYVCSGSLIYTLAPYHLQCGSILKNRPILLQWEFPSLATEVGGIDIDYAVNGSSTWNSLYSAAGVHTSYPYTVTKNWKTIAFRVRSYSTRSKYEMSECIYTGWLPIGASNAYIGRQGTPVPASMLQIGTKTGPAMLHVGKFRNSGN